MICTMIKYSKNHPRSSIIHYHLSVLIPNSPSQVVSEIPIWKRMGLTLSLYPQELEPLYAQIHRPKKQHQCRLVAGASSRLAWKSASRQALIFFHLTSSHKEIHNCPMELVWRKELRVFGNQQQIPMAAQQNKTRTQESIRKLYPTLNHKSSKCLPDKHSEIS